METWMHPTEKKLITDCLSDDLTMLEWGSGGSTLEFSSLVNKYYSIEHNEEWYNTISAELTNYPLNDVTYKFIKQNHNNPDDRQSEYYMFKDYIDIVDTFNEKFDIVLIDGRARRLCAKKIIPYLKSDSIIFIHDYVARKEVYGCVEDYYELVDSVSDTTQTIGKFKLRTEFKSPGYELTLSGFDRIGN